MCSSCPRPLLQCVGGGAIDEGPLQQTTAAQHRNDRGAHLCVQVWTVPRLRRSRRAQMRRDHQTAVGSGPRVGTALGGGAMADARPSARGYVAARVLMPYGGVCAAIACARLRCTAVMVLFDCGLGEVREL